MSGYAQAVLTLALAVALLGLAIWMCAQRSSRK